MSLRRKTLSEVSINGKTNHKRPIVWDPSSDRDISYLLNKIGDRAVVVDACLPSHLAKDLRRSGIYAVWVPSMLGDGASDEEIERQLLIGGYGMAHPSKEKVLLTRDVKFYRRIQRRAILVRYRPRRLSREIFSDGRHRQSNRIFHRSEMTKLKNGQSRIDYCLTEATSW